ncbi:MAG: hypothetical protein HC822_09965, partial [Oscillochloris sp.]|nr:hypothetical protein [Oscillochloris sp.]
MDRYVSPNNGLTHLYFRQRAHGIGVFNGDININVAADGRILNMGSLAVPHLHDSLNSVLPRIPAPKAVQRAADQLRLPVTEAIMPLTSLSGSDAHQLLSDGGISQDDIPVRLVYMPVAPGDLRLSWEMTLHLLNGEDWLFLRVDAQTGAILSQINYGAHSDDQISVHDHGVDHDNEDSAAAAHVAHGSAHGDLQSVGVDDGSSYRVYEFPKESPHEGDRTLVVNPADPTASPYGWHDTNGASGPEYGETRGNNTHAYADADNDGNPDANNPNGGAGLDFDLPLDLNQAPATYRDAAIVNLFYATNRIHDILFNNGFDEAAGNFQVTNYSGLGLGNDDVRAEAQDSSTGQSSQFANANFSTPPEGQRPRMQMYLGEIAQVTTLTVSSAAAPLAVGAASFGPLSFNLTAAVVLVANGTSQPRPLGDPPSATDGCEAVTNN